MGLLKKFKYNENEIITKEDLKDIEKEIYQIKEDVTKRPKTLNKEYFQWLKEKGERLKYLEIRLKKGLKASKKIEKENKKCS